MDIYDVIYNKKKELYSEKLLKILIYKEIDGINFISLDRRILKESIKLIKLFCENNIEFFLCDRFSINEKFIYKEDLPQILKNYLLTLEDYSFFELVQNYDKFNFIKNIINFCELYDCFDELDSQYETLKQVYFLYTWRDWQNGKTIWNVSNEKIREYYSDLKRNIKIDILIN